MASVWLAAVLLLVASFAPFAASPAETVTVVRTPRHGVLTVCRSWIVHRSCKPYNKVPIPERVAVGDRIKLTFGSNPKDYMFHIAQIRRKGDGCVILEQASIGPDEKKRLEVSICHPLGEKADY